MLYLKSMLKVIDNTGGQLAECIKVLKKHPKSNASVGDRIVCVIQKAKPLSADTSASGNKVKKGDIVHAVVVRTKQVRNTRDGFNIQFGDNACVLINKSTGEPLGSRIANNDGVVSKQLREKGHSKICSLASKVL
ncbi:39S ribosomal protein L38, mitochondrial [Hanseniaspora vineae]